MKLDARTRDAMLETVPSLRAFAIALCRNADRADDLVQTTLLKGLTNIESFRPGSNMAAWLYTILRNQFRSEHRRRFREIEDRDGTYAKALMSTPAQTIHLDLQELLAALAELPIDQREALILVGAIGLSYEEAANVCQCALGTVKSRVTRARQRLARILSIASVDDVGADAATRAVLATSCLPHL